MSGSRKIKISQRRGARGSVVTCGFGRARRGSSHCWGEREVGAGLGGPEAWPAKGRPCSCPGALQTPRTRRVPRRLPGWGDVPGHWAQHSEPLARGTPQHQPSQHPPPSSALAGAARERSCAGGHWAQAPGSAQPLASPQGLAKTKCRALRWEGLYVADMPQHRHWGLVTSPCAWVSLPLHYLCAIDGF